MDYDVAIVGGAFSGAATALVLKRRQPDARVLIIEKTSEFDRKVGESTTEVSTVSIPAARAFSARRNVTLSPPRRAGFRSSPGMRITPGTSPSGYAPISSCRGKGRRDERSDEFRRPHAGRAAARVETAVLLHVLHGEFLPGFDGENRSAASVMRSLASIFVVCLWVSGAAAADLSSLEDALLAEVNRMRENPQAYAGYATEVAREAADEIFVEPATAVVPTVSAHPSSAGSPSRAWQT